MNSKKKIALVYGLLLSLVCASQKSEKVQVYINTYKMIAIEEMKRTGVPAAIKLAQGIHETAAGTSQLVLNSNNHFGIKCKSNWTGESVRHDDDARAECFRKYPSAENSYKDHSDFLKNSQRYASLFLLAPTDYEGWANGLKKAGYATNPKYPLALIKLIEDYDLQQYTLLALNKEEVKNIEEVTTVVADTVTKTESSINNIIEKAKPAYPTGEFKINETRVVLVKKGTPFLKIATEYNLPLARIFEFNELSPSLETETDQLIYLQRKRKTGRSEFYTVKPGETLHDIAQAEGIRLQSLLELNSLKENDRPLPGEVLCLKTKASAVPRLTLNQNNKPHPGYKHTSAN